MARLIDADALIADVRKNAESYFADDFAREWVDKQPTIEAEPVRHGHWETYEDEPGDYCSLCGKETHDMHDEIIVFNGTKVIALCLPRYCGYCGAKMDEVIE